MLKLNINGQDVELDYITELELHEETINEDLKNQPSKFAFYCVLTEKAQEDLGEAKLALEILEAELDANIRLKLVEGKKPTEKSIQQTILLDLSYQEARMEIIMRAKAVGILRGLKESFAQRKEVLIALASNMRAQRDPDIYIKTQQLKQE